MSLERLFAPRSIAILGASENPSSVSWRILTSLERLGYGGAVHPINPRRRTVLGHACHAAIEDVPRGVDAIAFCVGREVIETHFDRAAAHGIGAAVLFDTGFAEAGEAGRAAQARIAARAREAGMAVLGPNGMGILSPATNASLYSGIVEEAGPLRGNVGVVTQSGAIAVGLLTDCRRYGFSHVVSSGNEAVTGLADLLGHLVRDEATRVIALFVEAVRDVPAFTAALDAAAEAGKPVVVLKVGSSARAKAAVLGHTGAVAGRGAAFSALLRRHRAIEVSAPDEMSEVLAACQSSRLPKGPRIGHVTASGGQVNLILDVAERRGFDLPPLASEGAARLREGTGIAAAVDNPLDAWGDGDWARNLPLALEVMGHDPNVDAVVFTSDTADGQPMRPTDYAPMLRAAAAASGKPHFFFNTRPGTFRQANVEALRGTGASVIGGVSQGLGAIHALGSAAARPPPVPLPPLADAPPLPDGAGPSIAETEAKALLAAAGIACTRDRPVTDEGQIEAAIAEAGFPLVLKAVSAAIAHRSDHGLVRTGIADAAALRAERGRMLRILTGMGVEAELVVGPQIGPGVEVLVGVATDPELGPCLVLGPGGVLVELLGDAAIRPLPLCEGDVAAMVAETRLGTLLAGVRGAPPSDAPALVAQVERIGRLAHAWGPDLREMDVNPMIVLPEGRGTCVLDAVIFPAGDQGDAP